MTDDRHIDPTRAAFDAFKALPREEPVWMLNLVRFKARAVYPPDHADAALGRTGAEAYREYGRLSGPVFERLGGEIVWRGAMQTVLIGPANERWDAMFIARYPTAGAFLAMVTDPAYKIAVVHRTAGVETSRLIRCQALDAGRSFA
jgi:uncharacterized protein (DUF1330 family)